jgi:intracellular multiplication protein IcmL
MAGEELEIVRLRNDFYRDGFYKVFIALTMAALAVILLGATSFYLYTHKPAPVTFYTDSDLRAFPLHPVTEPYVKQADLIQWVSEVLPASFTFDFADYDKQLKDLQQYYTPKGWAALITQLNTYANAKLIDSTKLFINAGASGTPTIPDQGMVDGRYGWLIQLPLKITYSSLDKRTDTSISLKALVVRVPTTNNLTGLAIDNVIVTASTKPKGGQAGQGRTNG